MKVQVSPTARGLKGTPYVLFYRVDVAAGTIWIAAAWSTVRASGPELP